MQRKRAVLGVAFALTLGLGGFIAAAPDADAAANARIRCEDKGGRLKIQVDGQDLAAGPYAALVQNLTLGGSVSKVKNLVLPPGVPLGSLDFDWDSTAGQGDLDTPINPAFANPGNLLRVIIFPGTLVGQATCRS